jgi:hypothetical protein
MTEEEFKEICKAVKYKDISFEIHNGRSFYKENLGEYIVSNRDVIIVFIEKLYVYLEVLDSKLISKLNEIEVHCSDLRFGMLVNKQVINDDLSSWSDILWKLYKLGKELGKLRDKM